MKKTLKASIGFMLSLLILCSILFGAPVSVSAYSRVDTGFGDWMGYKNDDGTLTLTGCRNIGEYVYDHTLNLPSEIDGKKVTGLDLYNGDDPFYIFDDPWSDSVTAIVLPDTIENVGETKLHWENDTSVFGAYTFIEKLVLPKNKNFGQDDAKNLFYLDYGKRYEKLKDLTVYDETQLEGLKRWSDDAFIHVEKLTLTSDEEINIRGAEEYSHEDEDGNITEVKAEVFPALRELYILAPHTVSLSGLHNLTQIDFSKENMLKNLTLQNMKSLKTLSLPGSLTVMKLSDCPNLTTVSYPGSISGLSIERLMNCPKAEIPVAYITYYEGAGNYLDDFLFESPYANSKIQEIHIDSRRAVNGIDKAFFRKMPSLKKFVVEGNSSKYYTLDGALYWKLGKYKNYYGQERYANDLAAYPAGKSTTGTLQLPKDTTCIYAYALDGCKFSSITFPENINQYYYWDSVSILDEENNWDTKYLTDFYPGKFRVVKGSRAADTWNDSILDRMEYYKGSKYNISYNLNGGKNNASNPTSYTAGDILTIKAPAKEGFKFLGWTRNESENSTDYYETTQRNGYFKDLTFTAHWQALPMPKKVVLSKSSETLAVNETLTLKATITPSNAQSAKTWSSSNAKVASVDKNGKVTAKAAGKATITVKTANGKTAACVITVKKAPAKVTLSKAKAALGIKETLALKASVSPAGAKAGITWSSSNAKVAAVDKNGKVTAKKAGTAKITAKTCNGKKAVCTVTVKKAPAKVGLSKTKATVKKGKTLTLKATLPKNTASNAITWKTSNKKVAAVDRNGKVKGVKKGTATITVLTYNGKKATCKITVK